MRVEQSIIVNAPPEQIFEIYSDVANWCQWDPDTKSSSISGPFASGTTGQLTPTKSNPVSILLTSVVPNKSFTVESRIPYLFRMVFEHELSKEQNATKVTHRATFYGPLSFLLGLVIGNQLRQALPVTLSNLKALAENEMRGF